MPRNNHEIPLWKKVAAGTAAALGTSGLFLTAGCSTENTPTPVATASQTGGETPSQTPSAEFTAGATGKYSPETLSTLGDEKLLERLQITGNSPQELVANQAQKLTAFMESGTSEEELAKYAPLTYDTIDQYINDMDEKYSTIASQAWNGGSELNQDTRIAHQIILKAFALNHMTGKMYPDFQIGTTQVLTVDVTKGSFDGATFTLQSTFDTSHNFDDSIIGKQFSSEHWYRSILNAVGKRERVVSYRRVGNHYIVSSDTSSAIE